MILAVFLCVDVCAAEWRGAVEVILTLTEPNKLEMVIPFTWIVLQEFLRIRAGVRFKFGLGLGLGLGLGFGFLHAVAPAFIVFSDGGNVKRVRLMMTPN